MLLKWNLKPEKCENLATREIITLYCKNCCYNIARTSRNVKYWSLYSTILKSYILSMIYCSLYENLAACERLYFYTVDFFTKISKKLFKNEQKLIKMCVSVFGMLYVLRTQKMANITFLCPQIAVTGI